MKDSNNNFIYDLTSEDKEMIREYKKFYADFFKFGNKLLDDCFPEPIEDYELTIYSAYYRFLELLDTLEIMTENSLINSGLLILRSLLELTAQLCYVLCDNDEIQKRATIWQMLDIKRTARDDETFYKAMSAKNCYKNYADILRNNKWSNWYSYCENKRMSIEDIFTIAGIKDLYDNLYRPLCFENHETNHMETNIIIDEYSKRFRFKPFRIFENDVLLMHSIIKVILPLNNMMIDRYGNEALKLEWKRYQDKAELLIKDDDSLAEIAKIFNPLNKWY
ncbi:MAG: hypothetical protein IJT21_03515 [Synergistaceae bacterium]|nr:hypothetical protein [Synergistaceae bacterium]